MKWQYFFTKRTKQPVRKPVYDSIETQLDIMIHATQITERYPFTKVRSTT